MSTLSSDVAAFVPAFDPLVPHPAHVRDPYRVYRQLREHAPMYRSPHGVWVASAHREVSYMLKDANFGRGYFYFENMAERLGPGILDQPVYASARNMMVMKDGDDHLRVRSAVARSFSLKRVEALRPFMRSVMNRLIDDALGKTSFDVMLDLAFPLPSAVICHLIGIPEHDWPKFSQRSANGSRALEPAPLSPLELFEQNKAINESHEYFQWLIELRRREPGDDLTSQLIAAEAEGKVTRAETIDNLRMMFVGGQETTVNTIGNGLLALYQHPDQLRALKSDMTLLPDAVTEMVRYDSAVQMTPRQARVDIEVAGASIKAGETILCIVASANRDSSAWPDADRFDISRRNSYPLSFGGGPHYCLGAQLGQVETEVALQTIFERLPDLRPEVDNPRWLPGTVVFRGLQSLPATA
ncbi:cytochrome P450 [Paraburkholderia saeva]|uniref:Biotin biosynthesis cytochrome P450 n=1 Tax=Paraburkholderia saeva TaxID=2777537 RepID=A0A9N8X466_9BURK|nr:cytochrome P450 [Paraburkholderia saeva]CAG4903096.1 Biotin biosynthesis cytochrome P450 [Paraburkholderia saeva]CAG4908696.1 Biotin biosynthesis cytochrome P450 [Paraburkholderia saeva]CAG4910395.1 Biotin biosynthesis cytochrome P450 [Paraburkholderia saeva]